MNASDIANDPYFENMDLLFFPLLGRQSIIQNEDEYDYAIELTADDEYRFCPAMFRLFTTSFTPLSQGLFIRC